MRNTKLFKLIISLLAFNLYLLNGLMAQNLNYAVDYLNVINEEYSTIVKDQWAYTKVIAHSKRAKKIEKRRKELLGSIITSKNKISKLPKFNGDGKFRDFVANHLDINYKVVNEDYAKIVDMEEVAEQSYDAMEAYLLAQEMASEKLKNAAKKMNEEYETFAADNNIKLVEGKSKIGDKMEVAGKVFKYYNKVYLLFFKSYKQDFYLWEAIQKRDINAIEQNKNSLLSYAKEDKEKLVELAHYKGDKSLASSCREVLNFYQDEAENQISVITDYYLKREKFDKIKAAFEKIKPNKRTQADVDSYNKAINDMNQAVAKYNEINTQLIDQKNKFIQAWNKSASSFLNKQVP